MVTHSIYCLPTDTLAGLKLLVRTYIIFEGIKYSLSLEHTNMTDITHSILKLIFSFVYSLTPILIFFFLFNLHFPSSVFACNNSRKKRGKGGHYSKIRANQKISPGGKRTVRPIPLHKLWLICLCFSVTWQNIFTNIHLYIVSTTKAIEINFFILCTNRHFFTIKLRLLIYVSIDLGLVQKKTLMILYWIILHAHNKCF